MYEFAVNRVVAVCEAAQASPDPSKRLCKRDLVTAFHRHMQCMQTNWMDKVHKRLRDAGGGTISEPNQATDDGRERDVRIFRLEDTDPGRADRDQLMPGEHLVGLFRSHSFRLETPRMVWMLRVKPSITACALARVDGLAKLWLSFEGVSANPESRYRPMSADAGDFVEKTTEIAHAALGSLRDAYHGALNAAVPERARPCMNFVDRRVRVSFADNNGFDFASLVDAMHIENAPFADALDGSFGSAAQDGAREVDDFVRRATGQLSPAADVQLDAATPGKAVVVCEAKNSLTIDDVVTRETVVAGLGSSLNMYPVPPGPSPIWNGAAYLRDISAARPLSARFANDKAIELDIELSRKMLAAA